MKLLYRPLSLVASIVGGVLRGTLKGFEKATGVWAGAGDSRN